MPYKPIHRNLQHQPRIWGVSFVKLFAVLFGMLLVLLAGFSILGQGWLALAVGAGLGLAGYGLAFYLDSRDPLERRPAAGFIRNRLSAGSLSHQCVRLRDEHL